MPMRSISSFCPQLCHRPRHEAFECEQVKEIRAICTDLTEEEAICALKLHKDRWALQKKS